MIFKLAQYLVLLGLMCHSVLAHKAHNSFQHLYGPVVGADHLVFWTDKHDHHHHHHHHDHRTKDNHSQKEHRDGEQVSGEYSLHEPAGNVRTVKYRTGKHGFHAHVRNSNGNDHSGGISHVHHAAGYQDHGYNNGLSRAYGDHEPEWLGFGRYGHWVSLLNRYCIWPQ